MKKIVIIEEIPNDKGNITPMYRGEIYIEEDKVKETIEDFKKMFNSEPHFKNYTCFEVVKENHS
nr:MAG TPA: hypothetical protein [Caudoviricetes sp.]